MKALLAQPHTELSLDKCLRGEGYEVITCSSADQVHAALSSEDLPDLAILDWNLLESDVEELLDRFEHCEHDLSLCVILLGTPENRHSMMQALNSGAHDFLLKPLDLELVQKKVRIMGKIVRNKQALIEASRVLERYSKHIDEVALQRTRQLVHAERLSTLGVLSAGIAHEINTPLGYISTSLETIRVYWGQLEEIISAKFKQEARDGETLIRFWNECRVFLAE